MMSVHEDIVVQDVDQRRTEELDSFVCVGKNPVVGDPDGRGFPKSDSVGVACGYVVVGYGHICRLVKLDAYVVPGDHVACCDRVLRVEELDAVSPVEVYLVVLDDPVI